MKKIKISNYENCKNERQQRLIDFLNLLEKEVSTRNYKQVLAVHDHKGTLEITFNSEISKIFKKTILSCWELMGECSVVIIIRDIVETREEFYF